MGGGGGLAHRVLVMSVRDERSSNGRSTGGLYRAVPVSQSSHKGICSLSDTDSSSISKPCQRVDSPEGLEITNRR